jgi:hypothetical protein
VAQNGAFAGLHTPGRSDLARAQIAEQIAGHGQIIRNIAGNRRATLGPGRRRAVAAIIRKYGTTS